MINRIFALLNHSQFSLHIKLTWYSLLVLSVRLIRRDCGHTKRLDCGQACQFLRFFALKTHILRHFSQFMLVLIIINWLGIVRAMQALARRGSVIWDRLRVKWSANITKSLTDRFFVSWGRSNTYRGFSGHGSAHVVQAWLGLSSSVIRRCDANLETLSDFLFRFSCVFWLFMLYTIYHISEANFGSLLVVLWWYNTDLWSIPGLSYLIIWVFHLFFNRRTALLWCYCTWWLRPCWIMQAYRCWLVVSRWRYHTNLRSLSRWSCRFSKDFRFFLGWLVLALSFFSARLFGLFWLHLGPIQIMQACRSWSIMVGRRCNTDLETLHNWSDRLNFFLILFFHFLGFLWLCYISWLWSCDVMQAHSCWLIILLRRGNADLNPLFRRGDWLRCVFRYLYGWINQILFSVIVGLLWLLRLLLRYWAIMLVGWCSLNVLLGRCYSYLKYFCRWWRGRFRQFFVYLQRL